MWKAGDRVVVTKCEHPGSLDLKVGDKGTIIEFTESPITGVKTDILVQFDRPINGHNGNAYGKVKGKAGCCWWFYSQLDDCKIGTTPNIEFCNIVCKRVKKKNNFY